MVFTVVVDCVALSMIESAVLAFLPRCMCLQALLQLFFDHFVERFVLAVLHHILSAVWTIGAAHARAMNTL